jgi:hypothetical protein
MAESKLLKEAIADAKAVRETAIANAKLALEEAFTPKLQSMLSKKIEEEAEDMDEDELEEQSDSSGLGKGDNKVDQADGDDYEKAETEKSSAAPGSEDGNLKVVDKLTEGEDDMDEDEDPEEMHDMEEDLDLEEIIRELEEEDDDEKTEMAYKEDEDMEETEDMDEGSYKEDEDMEEIEDMDETKDVEETEDMDEDIDLDEIIKSLQEEDEDDDKNEDEDPEEMAMKKEEELEEAYSTIRSLKATINEVNLLNAKLLFSNKLFKSHNLTEGQKMKIIETLDRAQNTREVKLVYSTLAESLSSGATKKATIKEGIASRATKSTAPAKEVIVETNQFSGRMKKLAGLL